MPSNYFDSARAGDATVPCPPDRYRAAKSLVQSLLGPAGTALVRRYRWSLMCRWEWRGRIQKPTDPRWLEVLEDPAFNASMIEVRDVSSLDTAQLANLWQWCSLSEDGSIVEVGAFRGGTSLHLSNCRPHRRIFVCDTFEGFVRLALDARFDAGVERTSWCNPDAAKVGALFAERGRHAVVLKGAFPESDRNGEVSDVSFAHIDVDIYESCHSSLNYLARRATSSALFIVNDFLRHRTAGVRHAVEDFVAANPNWIAIPAFPGQAVLLNCATYRGDGSGLARAEGGPI